MTIGPANLAKHFRYEHLQGKKPTDSRVPTTPRTTPPVVTPLRVCTLRNIIDGSLRLATRRVLRLPSGDAEVLGMQPSGFAIGREEHVYATQLTTCPA